MVADDVYKRAHVINVKEEEEGKHDTEPISSKPFNFIYDNMLNNLRIAGYRLCQLLE